ncbi:amidohydrolase 2 [Cylindrobasidium torrendii FP15055 ss-10]|uniref:Amidohydrolase 2 n=1 Tax=Cylindrobasidium torrendii FP15055 ss-10 TaxID=1314674 RepID=A0A0D7B5G9_9AGAR|nr:amidohydrolase 2 [Cylindrobasidium torrendii FP15055 ss-10]
MADNHLDLYEAAFNYPAIDNHTHALLREEFRHEADFESVFEAEGEAAKDTPFSVSGMRATHQLGKVLSLSNPTWEDVKKARSEMPYDELCNKFMLPNKIASVLIDDGPPAFKAMAEDYTWHTRFGCSAFRIVRLESEAEILLTEIFEKGETFGLSAFNETFTNRIEAYAILPEVVGFKSVVCYRTGLDISTSATDEDILATIPSFLSIFKKDGKLRIACKAFNDHIVRITLAIAAKHNKPVQFHTGLGDKSITLTVSSPAHMQPIIEAYPDTKFILLHSSYPYTRDAGYLTLVYKNVFLDFGEIFPMVSGHGQRSVIRQMFEVAPTNKILWSTDAHWFPETYYLGSIQSRQALHVVLGEMVSAGEITLPQAVQIIKDVLFNNSNRIYNLGLEAPP